MAPDSYAAAFLSRHLDLAWNAPRTPGTVLGNAGITLMTNVAFPYQDSGAAGFFGWGYQAASPPAEQVYSSEVVTSPGTMLWQERGKP
jgi:hypothetical protein